MLHARSRALTLPMAAAVAALAVVPAVAAARTAHPAAGTTLKVVEHANTDTEIPVASGGKDVKGDPLTFVNPVFNGADSKQVGHDEGFCMRLDVTSGTWECLWTTFVPGGSLTVQGPFYDTKDSTLAITGGTGKYRDARGQMLLHAFDGSKKYDFTFQIS